MYYAIYCNDRPGRLHVRQEIRPAHIDYLKSKGAMILAGGATLQEDNETMCGSLLIIEADSLAEAEDFAANDPFAKAGLFESVTVRPWRFALGTLKPE